MFARVKRVLREVRLRRRVIQKVKEFDEMLKLISDDNVKVKLINNFTTLMLYNEGEEVGRAVHALVMHKWVPEALRTPCPIPTAKYPTCMISLQRSIALEARSPAAHSGSSIATRLAPLNPVPRMW